MYQVKATEYNRFLRLIYVYVSNYQVYEALFKSVISMKDFRITTSSYGLID